MALFAGAVFAFLAFAPSAHAVGGVDELGLFELDGNAKDDLAAGDDWENVADGTSGAAVVTDGNQGGIIYDTYVPVNLDNVLTGGSTKDEIDIQYWLWKYAKPTPDKDNITNAYAAAYMNGSDLIIYFGADRFANNGDAMIGFWFFKSEVAADGTTHGFTGNHVEGDVLVLTNFTNGGAVDSVLVYEWVNSGGNTSEHLQLIAQSGACNATGQGICAVNNAGGQASYWPYTPKSGTADIFPMNSFFEGGINITALFNGATPCFTGFLAETRTSQSTDAVLKDFVLAGFPLCAIEASKECKVNDFAKETDPGYDPDMPLNASATVTVTNTGVGALPTGSEICVDDNPTGDSSQPAIQCVTLTEPLLSGDSKIFNFTFMTANNPPKNTATVTAVFDSQTLTADIPETLCNPIELSGDLFLEKDCTTSLTVESNLVAAQVNYGFRVCNTGVVPLSITLADPTAGIDKLVVLDFTDEPCPAGDKNKCPVVAGQCVAGHCANNADMVCTVDADCRECIQDRCVNNPGFITGENVCASYAGSYLPSEAYPVPPEAVLTPCNATFTNTVTATGTSEWLADPISETASATCPLCDNCQ